MTGLQLRQAEQLSGEAGDPGAVSTEHAPTYMDMNQQIRADLCWE